jgi:hypothetical protein
VYSCSSKKIIPDDKYDPDGKKYSSCNSPDPDELTTGIDYAIIYDSI